MLPRKQASTACPASFSAAALPYRARKRPNTSRKRSSAQRTNTPTAQRPNKALCTGRTAASCRLGRLSQRHQAAQDGRGSAQTRLGILPIVEEDNLHIGPHPRRRALIADKGDEPVGIGEGVVAERHHRTLGPGLDLLHIGPPAEQFDRDDLEEMLDLLRQRPETIDQLGCKGLDVALVLDFSKAPIERKPHR